MLETSIIIPVRNQKDTLLAALNSLKNQIKKPRVFEIVICDDDSTDGTGDVVKKLRFPIFFKYFINSPALGRAANRDQGVARSVGQRMIFIDGDMIPDENFIAAMLDDDMDSVKLGQVLPPPDEELNGLEKYLYSRGRYVHKEDGAVLPGRLFTSNNFCISRDNYAKIGGFDPKFTGWGGEDIDFGLRLEKAGIALKNAPKAITYHHHKRTLKSMTSDFYEFGKLTFEYLVEKHPEFLDQIPANLIGMKDSKGKIKPLPGLLSKLSVNSAVHGIISRMIITMSNNKWPDFVYDYLLWGSLAIGYKKRDIK